MNSPSRRDFMKVLTSYLVGISGLLGLAGIWRFLSFENGGAIVTDFDLGASSAFPVGSRTRVDKIPA
ncbi:MAG TPA: hypothetical protein VFH29_06850, partial [Anaerolineales bacterium]|nr:hypothetical protein [Anaerolineales bacterium]